MNSAFTRANALFDGDVSCRQHVLDARTSGRLEDPFGECVRYESLDLFRRLSLRTQLRDFQVARKKGARTFNIKERVRAGLRNAKLRGKTLGRPRRIVNGDEMARLREQGASFREIAEAVGASPGTVRTRLMQGD